MNNRNKFTKDWELLSAYLDGELSDRGMDRIAARLSDDQEFRRLLTDLKQTRGLLRSLPELKSPRNFILTEEMAGIKKTKRRLYPVFGLASALAGFMFVLVLFAESFGFGVAPGGQIDLPGFQAITSERASDQVAEYPAVEMEKTIPEGAPRLESLGVVAETEAVEVPLEAEASELLSPAVNQVPPQQAIEAVVVTSTLSIASDATPEEKIIGAPNRPTSEQTSDVVSEGERLSQPEIDGAIEGETTIVTPDSSRIPKNLGKPGDDGESMMELTQESYPPPVIRQDEDISSMDEPYPLDSGLSEFIPNIIDVIKISLAGIAIIAGITAIILRRSN